MGYSAAEIAFPDIVIQDAGMAVDLLDAQHPVCLSSHYLHPASRMAHHSNPS